MSPIISGGAGGGGNTTAQVVASGKVLPVAAPTGVTVDTTTYDNTISGSGKLTTLVFPADNGVLALALAGDAFPRLFLLSDPTDAIFYASDGTVDPESGNGILQASSNGSTSISGWQNSGRLIAGQIDVNRVTACAATKPLILTSGGAISSGAGDPSALGGVAGDIYIRTGSTTLILYRCTVTGVAGAATWVPVLQPGSPTGIVTSGALPTVQLVSGTGAQILTTRDAETITPCTFNPGVATTATVTVALSPDNVTYSTLGVETEPVGTVLDGTIHLVKVRVPAGWYLKLTVNAQATLGLTTYY